MSTEIARLTVLQRCRKRAADEEIPLRQIFDEECRQSNEAAVNVSFTYVESSMYKRRRTTMPTLPSKPGESDQAISGSRFGVLGQSPFYRGVVTASEDSSALVFASDAQLALLQQATLVHFDSTFKVVPSLYYQLFTIFVQHAGFLFPVFFALMTRKTTDLYKAVFDKLHETLPDFRPAQVIADYEEAPIAAMQSTFGNDLTVSGCWFHYAQSVVKQLRKLGLTNAYKNDPDTQKMLRCLMSLPLLPVDSINQAYQDIKSLLNPQSESKDQLEKMLRYVERQWLLKATIGPARLSVHDSPSRTNNAVESFHAALRRRIQVAHPNLFSFLGHLQRTTIDSTKDIQRLDRGLTIRRPKSRRNIINDTRIKTCVSKYDNGEYTRLQFLSAVSHSMGGHCAGLFVDECNESQSESEDVTQSENQNQSEHEIDDNRCEVCLIQPRDSRIALVPCGHQRFCEPCATRVHQEVLGCPLCRSPVNMILRLY